MLDLDTTIAYDEAEQDEEMPSSTPLDTSSSPLFTEDEASEAVDTQDSESILLRYRSRCQDDIFPRIELIPSFVLSSDNTNCKNDIQLFHQLFDELSVHTDYH